MQPFLNTVSERVGSYQRASSERAGTADVVQTEGEPWPLRIPKVIRWAQVSARW